MGAVAEDRRISDNSGNVLSINSNGTLPVTLSGSLGVSSGGTGITSVSNDSVLVGNNAGTGFDQPALPNCTDLTGNHLNYTAATGNFSCGTSMPGSTANALNLSAAYNNTDALTVANTSTGGFGYLLTLTHSANAAGAFGIVDYKRLVSSNADGVGFSYTMLDSGSASQEYAYLQGRIEDRTATSEDGCVDVQLTIAGTTRQTGLSVCSSGITTDKTFTDSNTGSMGWTVQAVANQACNTTCTSACVFGEDTSVLGSFVSCSDATADRCLCAGSS